MSTFKNFGFYSAKIENIESEKFVKIISLNTNLCYEYNLKTVFQYQDPGNQIEWLE